MTDRELIEAAAKAAGLWDYREQCIDIPWNPLNDDVDAFRLAVKLGIGLSGSESHVWACKLDVCDIHELRGNDPYAATRRAIVRAAASCSTHHV